MRQKRKRAGDVGRQNRSSVAWFESTEEWRQLRAEVDRGFKPIEQIDIIMTETDRKKYNFRSGRVIERFIKRYLRSKNLPYTVRSRRHGEADFVSVRYFPTDGSARHKAAGTGC